MSVSEVMRVCLGCCGGAYVYSVMSGLAAVCSGHLLTGVTGHSNEVFEFFSFLCLFGSRIEC